MTHTIHVKEGPFGLRNVDVYAPSDTRIGYKHPFKLASHVRSTYVCVKDAQQERVADAWLDHLNTHEQAAQWLLDFAYITAGGR